MGAIQNKNRTTAFADRAPWQRQCISIDAVQLQVSTAIGAGRTSRATAVHQPCHSRTSAVVAGRISRSTATDQAYTSRTSAVPQP
jgi:hypothetical protein